MFYLAVPWYHGLVFTLKKYGHAEFYRMPLCESLSIPIQLSVLSFLSAEELVSLALSCQLYTAPLSELHWELGDLSLTELAAKESAALLCNIKLSKFLAGHSWKRILLSLKEPWKCEECDSRNDGADRTCASCCLMRVEDRTPPPVCSPRAGTQKAKPEYHPVRCTADAVGYIIEKMNTALGHPQQTCRACKELQAIVGRGKKSAVVVVDLQAYCIIVKSMNACATKPIVQRCGSNTLRLISRNSNEHGQRAIRNEARKLNVGSRKVIAMLSFNNVQVHRQRKVK